MLGTKLAQAIGMIRRSPDRRSYRRQRGLTRFELIVGTAVSVLAIGAASWWMGSGQDANKQNSAERSARSLATVASEWKKENSQRGCPTVSLLRREAKYDANAPAADPWGSRFRISCSSDAVSVHSAGSDGRFETEDDILVDRDWTG